MRETYEVKEASIGAQTHSRALRFVYLVLFGVTVMLSPGFPAFGQQGSTAEVYGTVSDPQGAVVPGATVTALQAETNFSRTVITNNLGQYQLQLLPVGEYRITVDRTGFKKYVRLGILLEVNQIAKVNVALQLGETTTVVEVTGAAPLVNTRNNTMTHVVNSQEAVDLSLDGRQLADLAALSAGVVPANNGHGTKGVTDQGSGVKGAVGSRFYSINGNRNNDNQYTLDGADNNDTMYNTGMPFPFPDAVQEFSIQTAGQGVDVGKAPGGTINIVTKSGTNQIHGDAFWFVRNTALNARNFFSATQDQLKRNQGGFTLGGPVKKNKLFLFGGYERTWVRQRLGANLVQAIPTSHRQGNFSDLLQGTNPVQLTDPSTGLPYPNNQVPQSEWSTAFQKLMQWWPSPDAQGFVNSPVVNNENLYQFITRADYTINDDNRIYARYFEQNDNEARPLIGHNLATSNDGSQLTSYSAALGWTSILSPDLVVDTHAAMNYSPAHRILDSPWGNIAIALGIKINPLATEMDVSLNGSSGFDIGSAGRSADFRRGSFDINNSWRYTKGRHSFIFGTDFTIQRYNEYNPYHGSGVFGFNGQCTGFDQADALIGCLSSFTQGIGELEFRRYHYQSVFAGDSFRATRRLTLDFGLRWEPYMPITDIDNRNVQFREDTYLNGEHSQTWQNSPPGLFYPGDKVDGQYVAKGATASSLDLLGPRFGFAYDLKGNGRTAIRGGYGRFFSVPEVYIYNALSDQSPFGYDENFVGGNFDNPYLGRESANVFPFPPGFKGPNLPFPIPAFDYAQEPTFPQATIDEWNIAVGHQFGTSWQLQLAYVGNKSSHLFATYGINPPIYDFSQSLKQNQRDIQQRRTRPQFQMLDVLGSGFNSNYNALEVSLNKRFSRGFTMNVNYTWSKALDYTSQNGSIEEQNSSISDPFNILEYYGPSDWDVRNRFVAALVYSIPSTRTFVHSSALDIITRNWTLSPIVTLRSGFPFGIGSSGGITAGAGSATGVQLGPLQLSGNRSDGQKVAEWFNTANVAVAAPGT